MARPKVKFIPIRNVLPGQNFEHYQQKFTRATEDEAKKHPGSELAELRGADKIVLTYQLTEKGGRTPVSFSADEKVIVRERKSKRCRDCGGSANHPAGSSACKRIKIQKEGRVK